MRGLAVLALALSLGGCATVTRGTGDQVQINSDPQGAVVQTSLSQQCMTPCTLNVSRKDEFSVTINKPGYQPQTIFVATRVAGSGAAGFAGNILLGGVVGMGVDAATGATLEHYPNPVSAQLIPLPVEPLPGKLRRGAPVATRPAVTPPVVSQAPVMLPAPPEPQLSESDLVMGNRQ